MAHLKRVNYGGVPTVLPMRAHARARAEVDGANLARAAIIEQSIITCGAKTMEHAKTVWRPKLVAASPDK